MENDFSIQGKNQNQTQPASPTNQQGIVNTDNQKSTDIPPTNIDVSDASKVTTAKKGGLFKWFVIISMILILGIWAYVYYLYTQNKGIEITEDKEKISVTEQITITPFEEKPSILIENGNVVSRDSQGQSKVIVDKNAWVNTGILGFVELSVSPDYSKLCFNSLSPAPKPAIYISDFNGMDVSEISFNKNNCKWSPDNKMIAYNNIAKEDEEMDIYIYDLEGKLEKNISKQQSSTSSSALIDYILVEWSGDSRKVICKSKNHDTLDTTAYDDCEIEVK